MKIEELLAKGYFPPELPPPFHTSHLSLKHNRIKGKLAAVISKDASRCANFSIAKVGVVRKLLKIPNPIHQVRLSETISDNWVDIEKIYSSSKFSMSRPSIKGNRAANPRTFGEFLKRCYLQSFPYSFELKTDISKFYPSIYTHSIAWALHTKTVAKSTRSISLLGNRIDHQVQQTMHGQTIGIPIGPDTSLIIAEIIGSKIDELIKNKIPNAKGYRYIDDMYFFFHTYAEAEEMLIVIQQILKEYELQINSDKTKIRQIPHGIEPDWVIQLRKFEIRTTARKQYNDIISFFSLAFDLALKLPSEYVLSYSISRIQHLKILSDDNFKLLEKMLLKTVVAEPSTIKEVVRILLTYKDKISVINLQKVVFDFIEFNCLRGNDYELAWALWIIKSFEIKVPKKTAAILSGCADPTSTLIILDLIENELIKEDEIDLSVWKSKIDEHSLMDENWLLAYECAVKGWLLDDFSYIDKVPYFKILKQNKISFYDGNRQIDTILETTTKRKTPADKASDKTSKTPKKPVKTGTETYSSFLDELDLESDDPEQDLEYF